MISIIIPCYNEQETLPVFYKAASAVLEDIGCNYELLFVDDGSWDRTLAILKTLAGEDVHVTYLSFSRNFTLCLTATRYFLPLSPDWATGPLMNG